MRQSLYPKVLAKMDVRIKKAFDFQPKEVKLIPKTLVELAKQMGFIEGIRGPSGGYTATDKGVAFLGYDMDEFMAQENKQKAVDTDEVKRRQREASQARAAELAEMVSKAQKEFINEESTPGLKIRKSEKHA